MMRIWVIVCILLAGPIEITFVKSCDWLVEGRGLMQERSEGV